MADPTPRVYTADEIKRHGTDPLWWAEHREAVLRQLRDTPPAQPAPRDPLVVEIGEAVEHARITGDWSRYHAVRGRALTAIADKHSGKYQGPGGDL
jgi:hypothetical protein